MPPLQIPVCVPAGVPEWLVASLIGFLFLHHSLFIAGGLYSFYKHTRGIFLLSLTSQLVGLLAWGVQSLLRQPRPEPACVPFFLSPYGLPSPDIVNVVATSTFIMLYWGGVYYRTTECWPRHDGRSRPDTWGVCLWDVVCYVYNVISGAINVVVVLAAMVGYPLVMWAIRTVTFVQMAVSMLLAMGMSSMCFGVWWWCINKDRVRS